MGAGHSPSHAPVAYKAERMALQEVRTGLVPFEVIARAPAMEADA